MKQNANRDLLFLLLVGVWFSFAAKQEKSLRLKREVDEIEGSGFSSGTAAAAVYSLDDSDFIDGSSGDFAPTSLCRRQEIEASVKRHSKPTEAYIPQCDDEGQFTAKQCHLEECWCVNQYGHPVSGTRHHSSISYDCLPKEEKFTSLTGMTSSRQTLKVYLPSGTTVSLSGFAAAVDSRPDDVTIDETREVKLPKNKINPLMFENSIDIGLANPDTNEIEASMMERRATISPSRTPISNQPGLLAGIIGGTAFGLLSVVLFVMFLVYRMRKKDEGSYALDEPKSSPSTGFKKSRDREFFA